MVLKLCHLIWISVSVVNLITSKSFKVKHHVHAEDYSSSWITAGCSSSVTVLALKAVHHECQMSERKKRNTFVCEIVERYCIFVLIWRLVHFLWFIFQTQWMHTNAYMHHCGCCDPAVVVFMQITWGWICASMTFFRQFCICNCKHLQI